MLIRSLQRVVYSRKYGVARAVLQVVTLSLLFSLIFVMYQQVNVMSDGNAAAALSPYDEGESLSRHRRNSEDREKKEVTARTTTTTTATTTTTQSTTTTKKKNAIEKSPLKGYARVKDDCIDYYKAGRMQRTVHLHVLGRDELYRFNDITLVTQMTSERHDKLYRLTVRWSGPISVSIYLNGTADLNAYTKQLKVLLAPRKNIAVHIVKQSGEFFPVNFLRNIALDNAATKYVFLTDIDFEPMPRLDLRLQEYIDKGYIKQLTALIVPVFEFVTETVTKFPEDKKELMEMWKKKKIIKPFHFNTTGSHEYPTTGHKQTDYSWWEKTKKPYYVNWAEYYEPYVILEKAASPKYWPYYVGRFFNKASHIAEMFAMGFQLLVLPDVFAVHTPHPPKPGNAIEKNCGKRVNVNFKIYLMDTYGWKMPVKIK